jgi:hypothetical protein
MSVLVFDGVNGNPESKFDIPIIGNSIHRAALSRVCRQTFRLLGKSKGKAAERATSICGKSVKIAFFRRTLAIRVPVREKRRLWVGHGSGIPSERQIFRTRMSGISECLGMGSRRPVCGFQYMVCDPPSRFIGQPCDSKWRINSRRFTRSESTHCLPEDFGGRLPGDLPRATEWRLSGFQCIPFVFHLDHWLREILGRTQRTIFLRDVSGR